MFYNMLPSIVKNHTYTNSLEIIIKRAIESSNLACSKSNYMYATFNKYKMPKMANDPQRNLKIISHLQLPKHYNSTVKNGPNETLK